MEGEKDLCRFLFPKLGEAYSGDSFGSDRERIWEENKRICSERYFPFYFHLAVPEGEVSNAELIRALEECTSDEKFVVVLETFNASGRFAAFIDALRHRLKTLERNKLRIILNSIFIYGDRVSQEGTGAMGLISDHLRLASWLLLDVIALLGEGRFDELLNAMKGKPAVYTVVSVTNLFENLLSSGETAALSLRGKYADLTPQVVERMKAIALDDIELAATNHLLESAPLLPAILYRWKQWAENRADAWIKETFLSNPHSSVSFVSRFVHQSRSYSLTDKVANVKKRIALKSMSEFVDLHLLSNLVNQSVDAELTPEEIEAKKLFQSAMDKVNAGLSLERIDGPSNFD